MGDNKPRHVGIILDGNRRFAKQLGLNVHKGHELGYEKVKKLLGWCKKHGIREMTIYALSIQNFRSRPRSEFNYLMDLFRKSFREIYDGKEVHKERVRVRAIGRINLLPDDLQEAIRKAEESTKDYDDYYFNVAIAYGGREEIVDAVKKIGRGIEDGTIDPDEISEDMFANHLYMSSEPDLVIRTGGDHRTSNFLLWQSNYSEFIFLEKKWPEFEEEDLVKCIEEFRKRERRFGK